MNGLRTIFQWLHATATKENHRRSKPKAARLLGVRPKCMATDDGGCRSDADCTESRSISIGILLAAPKLCGCSHVWSHRSNPSANVAMHRAYVQQLRSFAVLQCASAWSRCCAWSRGIAHPRAGGTIGCLDRTLFLRKKMMAIRFSRLSQFLSPCNMFRGVCA